MAWGFTPSFLITSFINACLFAHENVENPERGVTYINTNMDILLSFYDLKTRNELGEANGIMSFPNWQVSIQLSCSVDKIQFPDSLTVQKEPTGYDMCVFVHSLQPGIDDDEKFEGRSRKVTNRSKFLFFANRYFSTSPLRSGKPKHFFSLSYFIHDALKTCTGWSFTECRSRVLQQPLFESLSACV